MKRIGILALQGAVDEHLSQLKQLGIAAIKVKDKRALSHLDGLIIPGGESTVISHLMEKQDLHTAIRAFSANGGAVLGTCAGLILCSLRVNSSHPGNQPVTPLGLIEITTERNGFGRQIDSFEQSVEIVDFDRPVIGLFIRAPYIISAQPGVEILATLDKQIVMARQNRCLVTSFHPELTPDLRIMQLFLSMID